MKEGNYDPIAAGKAAANELWDAKWAKEKALLKAHLEKYSGKYGFTVDENSDLHALCNTLHTKLLIEKLGITVLPEEEDDPFIIEKKIDEGIAALIKTQGREYALQIMDNARKEAFGPSGDPLHRER